MDLIETIIGLISRGMGNEVNRLPLLSLSIFAKMNFQSLNMLYTCDGNNEVLS